MKKFSLFFISIIFLSCEFILYDLVKEEKPTTVSDNFSISDTIPNAEGKIITESLNSFEEQEEEENSFDLNWANPVMGPYGASVGNLSLIHISEPTRPR